MSGASRALASDARCRPAPARGACCRRAPAPGYSRCARLWLGLVLVAGGPALADSPREFIRRGNEHYRAGRYAEALAAYRQAAGRQSGPPAAELLHDQAAAHFKLGQIDEARELWVRAAARGDAAFEAAARYNLGNCDYADALQALRTGNARHALELLGRATERYRDALRLDPRLTDARANLELAEMLKRQLGQRSTTRPGSRPSSRRQSDRQAQRQGSRRPASRPASGQLRAATQPARPESQPSRQQPPPPEAARSRPAPASQPPSPLATRPAGSRQPPPQAPPTVRMTRAQAERLLQMIRDAERARRQMLRRREAARHRPVEKDW